jgi:hypothetical protein
LITRETDIIETPASRATSPIVIFFVIISFAVVSANVSANYSLSFGHLACQLFFWFFDTLRGKLCRWGCFAGETRKTPPYLPLTLQNLQ